MSDAIAPFHQQAEDFGAFVIRDRARDAARRARDEEAEGPSENAD